MRIHRQKLFSGYSEVMPGGVSGYMNAQVVLNPIESVVDKIDSSPIGSMKPVKKKTGLIKNATSSLKVLFRSKKEKRTNNYKK